MAINMKSHNTRSKMPHLVLLLVAAMMPWSPSHAFRTSDYLFRRLAEEASNASDDPSGTESLTCPEGRDDDTTLASNDQAKQFGLTSCAQTYEILTQSMGNADLLCRSMGAGICNCTCAGDEAEVSEKIEFVPWGEAPDLGGGTGSAMYDCADVGSGGDGDATLLPSHTKEWMCAELGDVGVLLWKTSENGESLTLAAEFASAGGGAAIGFSANGGMFGADLLWVGKDAESDGWEVRDMFSRGYAEDGSFVTVDDSQDAELEWSDEGDGRMAFLVTRPLKPCDQIDDLEISPGPTPVIWARFFDHGHSYHGPGKDYRGTIYLDLLTGDGDLADGIPEDPSDLFTVDMRMGEGDNRYTLPSGQVNTYACRSFEMPMDKPYQMIAFESILDTANTDANVVHHIVLYSCEVDAGSPNPEECGSMSSMCQEVEIAWAVGMSRQYLPVEAGIPLKKYFLMEMHYENLKMEDGVQDGSGLRLTFTQKPRMHEFGYLIVGTSLGRTDNLGPGKENIKRQGFCAAECLAAAVPETGVQVHGQFFHSHLTGRSLQTQHFRGEEELRHLGDMPFYDFNHQSFKYESHKPQLMPGDALVTTCTYNTKDKTEPTSFGLETADEMCFNMIGIYPRIDMQFCWNSTLEGGSCSWGQEEEATGGVPFSEIPYVHPIPAQCSEDEADVELDGKSPDDTTAIFSSGAGELSVVLGVVLTTFLQILSLF